MPAAAANSTYFATGGSRNLNIMPIMYVYKELVEHITSVADPDPGSDAF